MVERGRERVGAATSALVVADDVHPRSQRLLRDAAHILRIARAFESMHNDNGQRPGTIRLPVVVAEHPDAGRRPR